MQQNNIQNYLNLSEKTENKNYSEISSRVDDPKIIQLLHAGIGLATESGEFLDSIKKNVFYGTNLNEPNLREELGDLMWYIALACRSLNVSIEEICEKNITKLSIRYPEKFSQECSENRDINKELEKM